MKKKSSAIRNTVAATVAAAGLAVGAVGLASADDGQVSTDPSSATRPAPPGSGRRPGDGRRLQAGRGARRLRVESAGRHGRGARGSGPPTATGRLLRPRPTATRSSPSWPPPSPRKLGLSEADVTAALEEVHAAHQAEGRSALSDRLDEAVDADDLAGRGRGGSVLKAFDAGVLGGGPGGRPGPR